MDYLNRRAALITSGAGLFSSFALSSCGESLNPISKNKDLFDLYDPKTVTPIYARLRGNPNEKMSIWWYGGMVYGKLLNQMSTPLFRVHGIGFNRFRKINDNTYEQTVAEAGYFADLKTLKIIDEWDNPLNNKRVKIEHYRSIVVNDIDLNGTETSRNSKVIFNGEVGPILTNGNKLWVTENLVARIPLPSPPGVSEDKKLFIDSTYLSTFEANILDIQNKNLEHVPGSTSFQAITNFYPWMELGAKPGEVIWQIMGRKLDDISQVPQFQRDRLNLDHPDFIENPGV